MTTSQNLEEVLGSAVGEVKNLKRVLVDKIVVQKKESHKETYTEEVEDWVGSFDAPQYTGTFSQREFTKEVIDRPELIDFEFNPQDREKARQRLRQIYDSSGWYSVKYLAGDCLHFDDVTFKSPMDTLNTWLEELKKELNSEIVFQEEESKYTEEDIPYYDYSEAMCDTSNGRNYTKRELISYKPRVAELDIEKRKKAVIDLKKLREISYSLRSDNLLSDASWTNESKEIREMILREAFGYSPLKIWSHEHPLITTLGVMTAVGVSSSLGYMFYQYFSR